MWSLSYIIGTEFRCTLDIIRYTHWYNVYCSSLLLQCRRFTIYWTRKLDTMNWHIRKYYSLNQLQTIVHLNLPVSVILNAYKSSRHLCTTRVLSYSMFFGEVEDSLTTFLLAKSIICSKFSLLASLWILHNFSSRQSLWFPDNFDVARPHWIVTFLNSYSYEIRLF
jgi:hypothetical protein